MTRVLTPVSAAFAGVVAVLALRGLIEGMWLLPSPVGDSTFFLTASVNLCQSGFFGTTAFPIDPTGHSRMVWHGFVSPMLFSVMNPACGADTYYLTLWLIKAFTAGCILWVGHRRSYPILASVGVAIFALAAQSCIAFRPESVAILLIVLAELAIDRDQAVLLGGLMGTLLCTQPTVAGLHALVLVCARPELLRRWWRIGLGYVAAAGLLIALYPFPLRDLINGILLQAKHLVDRSDGGVISYYVTFPLLPGWSILLILAGAVVGRRRPLLLLLLPVFWFFGPRVPPTFYNLLPSCVLLLLIACGQGSPRAARLLGAAGLCVGILGLGLLSTRDAMTVARYGDTFQRTRLAVEQLISAGARVVVAPPLVALTNPELRITDPLAPPAAADRYPIDLYAVNGRPVSPCPAEAPGTQVSLEIGTATLFNSNSGWMVYVCSQPYPHGKYL